MGGYIGAEIRRSGPHSGRFLVGAMGAPKMTKNPPKKALAAWVTMGGVLALCSALYFQQHIRKANAATTNYPPAPAATYTPDTLLW
jgi:hypothetical protein